MKKIIYVLLSIWCLLPIKLMAQEDVDVHDSAIYVVGDHDNVTLNEAKQRCIELAKLEAIKKTFGEKVTGEIRDKYIDVNGKVSTETMLITSTRAGGTWLKDTKEPAINISYIDGQLKFKAKVWGKVREIVRSQTDIEWCILTGRNGAFNERKFEPHDHVDVESGDNLYVGFKSPADGCIAIYLIEGEKTYCLLPYKKNTTGQQLIKHGKYYRFFDEMEDPDAKRLKLTTSNQNEIEMSRLVIIYSKNRFTKCNDNTGDIKHPNSLSTKDFYKWLNKCYVDDTDMLVNEKNITIRKK